MAETSERARIAVVSSDDASTLGDCLDAVGEMAADGVEVIVVDLDSADGSADVAIRHPAPDRVVVVRPGDPDRVIDAASVDLGPRPLVVLPADRRPATGLLESALAALGPAWLALGPDTDLGCLAVDRTHLQHVSLLTGVTDRDALVRRVRDAGGDVVVAEGMRTAPARASGSAPAPTSHLPPAHRAPPDLTRHDGLISVVLCTKDRPESLARCLCSLIALDDPCYEIVVVDNHERATVDLGPHASRARLVHEPRPGLDVARNSGVAEARGEILAFVDDDCEVDPGWLDGLRVAFGHPEVDAVTGRVRPASLREAPQRWFEAQFSFDRGTLRRRFTQWDRRPWYPLWTGGVGTGCNMSFRRGALRDMGGFDEILDMGTRIGGGGDLDAFARLIDLGGVIEYTPAALVWHHHRATELGARRQFWGYGVSVGALLTKSVIERPGLRLAALRFFVDRLRMGARTLRQARAGEHLLPIRLALLDLAGQWVGVVVYLVARRRAAARRA